jgi:hypothetical protein
MEMRGLHTVNDFQKRMDDFYTAGISLLTLSTVRKFFDLNNTVEQFVT